MRPRRSKTNPRVSNGHRRRQAVVHVRARDTHCALCGAWIDPNLTTLPGAHGPRCAGRTQRGAPCPGCVPHPHRGEVDEDIPVSRGGSPYDPSNLALMHRACNNWKSDRTLAEARRALALDRATLTVPRVAPDLTRRKPPTSREW